MPGSKSSASASASRQAVLAGGLPEARLSAAAPAPFWWSARRRRPRKSLSTRAERLADVIAGDDCLAAVIDRDGRVLGASGGFDDARAGLRPRSTR